MNGSPLAPLLQLEPLLHNDAILVHPEEALLAHLELVVLPRVLEIPEEREREERGKRGGRENKRIVT